MLGKIDESRLEVILMEAIEEAFEKADAAGIDHPYCTEKTSALMAQAAMAVVKACELSQEEDAG